MTLGYSTTWPERMGELAGRPTHFQEKIIEGLLQDKSIPIDKKEWPKFLVGTEVSDYVLGSLDPKMHSIRGDRFNRWKPGRSIHMAVRNRTKNRFQFAPVVPCVSDQSIEITYGIGIIQVKIGDNVCSAFFHADGDIYEHEGFLGENHDEPCLWKNDGFASLEDFFRYFDTDFSGKIIHWTNLKY